MQKIADFREREERGPTFEEMAGEWWEQHEPLIRHGTVHGYKAAMGRAVEYFGSDPVKQIEAADINAFLLYTAKRGYAQKTVKKQVKQNLILMEHIMHTSDFSSRIHGFSVISGSALH